MKRDLYHGSDDGYEIWNNLKMRIFLGRNFQVADSSIIKNQPIANYCYKM